MKVDFDYLNKHVVGSNEPPDLDIELDDDFVEIGVSRFKLTEPQSRFWELTCSNPLFIGGYGSGKTTIKVLSGINDVTQFSGGSVALYDPTFDQIGLNTAVRIEEILTDLDMPYKYDKQKQVVFIEDHGKMILRSMNNPERIVGYEVFRSHVDEIGVVHPNSVEKVWNRIVARNRQKVPILDNDNRKVIDIKTKKPLLEQNRISAYGTPDDGYGFTYKMWGKDPAAGYEYVRAPTYSNAENIPETYLEQLRKIYPAGLVDAFIEGFWTNFTTGAVFYGFDRDKHKTLYTVAEREQLHIGMDFNVYNMAAAVGVLRKGKLYGVDEFVDLRDTPDMIKAIKNRYPEHRVIVYPDPTGKKTSSQDSNKSDHKLLREAGFRIKAKKGSPGVRDSILSVNAAYEKEHIAINILACPQLVEAQEQQPYDKNGVPDKTTGQDHINDGWRYMVHWLFPIKRPVVSTIGVRTI